MSTGFCWASNKAEEFVVPLLLGADGVVDSDETLSENFINSLPTNNKKKV